MKSKKIAMSLLKDLLESVDVAAVTGNEVRKTVNLDWGDFEDAVQYAAGESIAVDYIVTRNKKDFVSATLPVVSPAGLLHLLFFIYKMSINPHEKAALINIVPNYQGIILFFANKGQSEGRCGCGKIFGIPRRNRPANKNINLSANKSRPA
ncbi:MAG: PIN domain-containing protein [Treponema sp.]|jgi:hypothetical protein|nr:PIN domain-containing protein [Treponema sp.]